MSMEATLATWELIRDDISSLEKLLLLSLARRASENHTCWPSVARISADTGINRKYIISNRQKLIDKGLLSYTGEMRGKSNQIPVMKLLYVEAWEHARNSPRINEESVDKLDDKNFTSPQKGTRTSPQKGTRTSPQKGTLNSKVETKIEINRASKNFKKLKLVPFNFELNDKTHKILWDTAERVKMLPDELLEKFFKISAKYKTKSSNWEETFIEFMQRERPRKTYEDKNGKLRRYDGGRLHYEA